MKRTVLPGKVDSDNMGDRVRSLVHKFILTLHPRIDE